MVPVVHVINVIYAPSLCYSVLHARACRGFASIAFLITNSASSRLPGLFRVAPQAYTVSKLVRNGHGSRQQGQVLDRVLDLADVIRGPRALGERPLSCRAAVGKTLLVPYCSSGPRCSRASRAWYTTAGWLEAVQSGTAES